MVSTLLLSHESLLGIFLIGINTAIAEAREDSQVFGCSLGLCVTSWLSLYPFLHFGRPATPGHILHCSNLQIMSLTVVR